MGTTTGQFISALTDGHDVIVIGGLAVIAHGFNRPTKDVDVWLNPLSSPQAWADILEQICKRFTDLSIHTLPGWRTVIGSEVAVAAEEIGMVRILGLDCPLDIFRKPNEFSADEFSVVLSRATRNTDGTWLPDPIDLAISKEMTNRDKDMQDVNFLESIVRKRWVDQLPTASADEARALLDRFVDWRTCEAALLNPSPVVREMALAYLREFAADGDPFSQALLSSTQIPPA
ncbi:MAG: hypothetical protein H8M99_14500 [Gloeobacteraceae cyanobacterium ES-bin-144]|nr:hypothetical protein [Verrucomicrobiales bacterium]